MYELWCVEQNWLTISLDLIIDGGLRPRLSELHPGCHSVIGFRDELVGRADASHALTNHRLTTKWGYTPGEVDGLLRAPLLLPLTDHLRRSGVDGLDVATCAKAAGARPIRMRSHPGGTA